MNGILIQRVYGTYLEFSMAGDRISTESDALDIVSQCGENGTRRALFTEEALSDEFMNLKTGLAGAVFQKFINYGIKAAIVILQPELINDRFAEMAWEYNNGGNLRFFKNREDAERWLTN